MSEAHNLNQTPKTAESAVVPFLSCTTLEDLLSLTPKDSTTPLVIFGDGELKGQRSEELAERIRARGVKNPMIYYVPSRSVSPNERAQFLDAGGDSLIDARDIGPIEQDPKKDVILQRLIRNLSETAQVRLEGNRVHEYEFGITHDPRTASFSVNGTRLTLTAYEYKILDAFFMLRGDSPEGTRISTASLCKEVYADDMVDVHSNGLGVLIGFLNKKFKKHGIRLRGRVAGKSLGYAIERA